MSAFSASFCIKGKLASSEFFVGIHSKVKVMMIVITIPFKSKNEIFTDSNRFWFLNKATDLNG